MPYESLEVRWFFDGALAADVEAWYAGGGSADGGPTGPLWPDHGRTDRYLVLPGVDDLGIKLRDGRFEFKGRVGDFGVRSFADGNHGRTEHWVKWSHPLEDASPEHGAGRGWPIADAKRFVFVGKRRMVRYVAIASQAPVEPPFDTARTGPVIGFELARLRLGDATAETHWSVAFEAFPYGPDLHEPFADAVATLLAGWPSAPLSAERSLSYPAWLSRTYRL